MKNKHFICYLRANLCFQIFRYDPHFYKLLKHNDPLLHFIQKIRDEAHRFAINSHRTKRNKIALQSVFDEIQGIGKIKKQYLLKHFGNIKNIRHAKVEELNSVKGINKNLAEYIYGFFHSH